jgi:hypothetical protein
MITISNRAFCAKIERECSEQSISMFFLISQTYVTDTSVACVYVLYTSRIYFSGRGANEQANLGVRLCVMNQEVFRDTWFQMVNINVRGWKPLRRMSFLQLGNLNSVCSL